MPRSYSPRQTFYIAPIACSRKTLAEHLGIPYARVLAAPPDVLPVYRNGTKRLVLIVDAIAWIRSWQTEGGPHA